MGKLSTVGKWTFGLTLGAIGVLAASKISDDSYVNEIWQELEDSPGGTGVFSEEMVADLPEPARRYFLHAIKPGTPLATKMHWRWSGRMKPSREAPWMDLTSEQVSVQGRGFAWKARAGRGPLTLTAADHYLDGEGRMKIFLFGLVPVVNATGPDLSKSSLGRMLAECVFMPSALLPGPHVRIEAVDEARFKVVLMANGGEIPYTMAVDDEGRLTSDSVLQRWGNLTPDGSYQFIPYGGVMEEERTFGGYTIPTRLRVGWWYGTERYFEVIELQVDSVEYS